ncbi:unnamed protein product [Prunus armeniaca]
MALEIGILFEVCKESVENHFGGATYSILVVNGEEFTWSTSLCKESLKSPPIFKSQNQSFTSIASVPPRCFFREDLVDYPTCVTCSCIELARDPLQLVFVSWFFRTKQSKAKVSDQVNLVKELFNQVILIVHSLIQLANYKIEVCLTSWIRRREFCGAQLHMG